MASSVDTSLRVTEYDESGNVTATFVGSRTSATGLSRIDRIPPAAPKSIWQKTLDIFLPVGYPYSVTSDYLEYQIYDSLQAFSSSIAGLLSSRAVLSSVGVGDSTASPTTALLLSILQETAGRIVTILFAHRLGTALEPECKMYRLLADVLNDAAFVLDCLSPAFPKALRVVVLSFSSCLRALCGVAAGSAKASLSAHFARWGNLGELNAKDSSQETVISLMGMLVGSLVVSVVTTPVATWTTLIVLLSIHLETNRRAVRAVSMRSINRQRATIICHHLQRDHVPSPQEVARQEWIFERDGVVRDASGTILGYCILGVPVDKLLRKHPPSSKQDKPSQAGSDWTALLDVYSDSEYISWTEPAGNGTTNSYVVLKKDASPQDVLVSWWQAVLAAAMVKSQSGKVTLTGKDESGRTLLRQLKTQSKALLSKYKERLIEVGWDLNTGALETTERIRCTIEQ